MTASHLGKPASSTPRIVVQTLLLVGLALPVVTFAPFRLAGIGPGGGYRSPSDLGQAMASGLVHYWAAGSTRLGPALAHPVEFWARFHVIKAVLAVALLIVLTALIVRTARGLSAADDRKARLALSACAVTQVPVALIALLMVIANIQGAVAPLSSALGLLPLHSPDPDLAATVGQVRQTLADGAASPAADALVADFARYHAAMLGLGALVTAALSATVVVLWRRWARIPFAQNRSRRVLAATMVGVATMSLFFGVVSAANLSTLKHPAPALLAFFEGAA